DVRHGEAGHLDARQRGHVRHLLGTLVLLDLLDQGVVGEDDAVDFHVRPVALGNAPLTRADRLQRPGVSALLGHRFSSWLSPTRCSRYPPIITKARHQGAGAGSPLSAW